MDLPALLSTHQLLRKYRNSAKPGRSLKKRLAYERALVKLTQLQVVSCADVKAVIEIQSKYPNKGWKPDLCVSKHYRKVIRAARKNFDVIPLDLPLAPPPSTPGNTTGGEAFEAGADDDESGAGTEDDEAAADP
ncbi:OLC1v1011810C1 [Oldenlandia corymbosa var. corymbosa]|uniref:OLC1v1011810C1 n=1 Tax=Oldenlandia corymbosa var. corymbosa TaxID=529605 RepID=A0AAV1DV35_OLDCO|nr:OLC1v1011810C1 [Oldenlandia corymbosa var. corymbosa]